MNLLMRYYYMLSVTLKTHKKIFPNSGFNKQSMDLSSIKYGSTIQSVMDNLNQFRGPDTQILKLFNQFGQEIPNQLWKMPIKENMIFYIDQPNI